MLHFWVVSSTYLFIFGFSVSPLCPWLSVARSPMGPAVSSVFRQPASPIEYLYAGCDLLKCCPAYHNCCLTYVLASLANRKRDGKHMASSLWKWALYWLQLLMPIQRVSVTFLIFCQNLHVLPVCKPQSTVWLSSRIKREENGLIARLFWE